MRLAPIACLALSLSAAPPGKDIRYSHHSALDDTDQPYRVYVPAAYDGGRPWPMLFLLHGTGGNENTLLDDERFGPHYMALAAERRGVILVSPYARGVTEYRGIGEHDLFCVLEDVKRRYRIDEDRVYITGHSMGGTGSAYQALHHPDVYAAAVAFAPAYSFPWLLPNARHAPIWWIMGGADEAFYHMGIDIGIERMRRLGIPHRYLNLPGEGHAGPLQRFDEALGWMLGQRRQAHPAEYEMVVDTPLHGRVWWTSVEKMEKPGKVAVVKASAKAGRAELTLTNVAELALTPDAALFRPAAPLEVVVNGARVFRGRIPPGQELLIAGRKGKLRAARPFSRVAYRNHPVAVAPQSLEATGEKAPLARWIAEAMRSATGADLALYNRRHYRGLPLPKGTVDVVDLIQASRPFDQFLVEVTLSGSDVAEIIRANAKEEDRKVFLSGATPDTLDPARRYRVALEGQVVERETMYLAGRFRKLDFKVTDVPFTLALYGYAAAQGALAAPAR